jgi:hypothetical protein
MASHFNPADYMAYWPKFLPFPYALRRDKKKVPNSNSVNWPQSQFAPLYLPAGSPSFQPYSYLKNDVPLASQRPRYSTKNIDWGTRSGVGPGGDIAQLPQGYGDLMLSNPSDGVKKRRVQQLTKLIRNLKTKRQTPDVQRKLKKANLLRRALLVELNTKKPEEFVGLRARMKAREKVQHTVRQGWKSTGLPIAGGVPQTTSATTPPPSNFLPCGPVASATGLAGDLGDGFAYHLAPLTAQSPYGDLALENGSCESCANNNPALDWKMIAVGAVGAFALMKLVG